MTTSFLPSDKSIWFSWMSQYSHPIICNLLELRVFEVIHQKQPINIVDLSKLVSVHPAPLSECLLYCRGEQLNLVSCNENLEYFLTQTAENFLLESSEHYWGHMFTDEFGLSKQSLKNLLQTGNPQWGILSSWEKGEVPEDRKRQVMRGMNSHSSPAAHSMVKTVLPKILEQITPRSNQINWLDVAGGSGIYSSVTKLNFPNLNCTVFELPDNYELTNEFTENFAISHNVDNNVKVLKGNMFTDQWPSSDYVFMSEIWHDWSDEQCLQLAKQAKSSSKMLILNELVKEDNQTSPDNAVPTLFSLHMMFCTRGKQRTLQEFEEILQEAGFSSITIYRNYFSVWSLVVAQ